MLSTVKKILKKILPVVFFKKAAVLYIRIKASTFDKLVFPEFLIKENDFMMFMNVNPPALYNLSLRGVQDQQVEEIMEYWNTWKQEEYILQEKHYTLIEPAFGWGITSHKLHYYSLGISRAPHQPKPQMEYKSKP